MTLVVHWVCTCKEVLNKRRGNNSIALGLHIPEGFWRRKVLFEIPVDVELHLQARLIQFRESLRRPAKCDNVDDVQVGEQRVLDRNVSGYQIDEWGNKADELQVACACSNGSAVGVGKVGENGLADGLVP
jgi:hypothetical protein